MNSPWSYRPGWYLTHPWEVVSDLYRWVKNGLRGLWVWFPVIWKDRDWHWALIYRVLQFKMKRTRLHQEHFGVAVWNQRKHWVSQLRECELLLDRICDNEIFYMNMYDMGNPHPDYSKCGVKDGMFNSDPAFAHMSEKERSRYFLKKGEYCEYMWNQDVDRLFMLMKKYSRDWWD